MATMEQTLVEVELRTKLVVANKVIKELERLKASVPTDADIRRIDALLSELERSYVFLFGQYELAKRGASQLQPPSQELINRLGALSDEVSRYAANDRALESGLQIAGRVAEMLKA
jgi:hypothetical protein